MKRGGTVQKTAHLGKREKQSRSVNRSRDQGRCAFDPPFEAIEMDVHNLEEKKIEELQLGRYLDNGPTTAFSTGRDMGGIWEGISASDCGVVVQRKFGTD